MNISTFIPAYIEATAFERVVEEYLGNSDKLLLVGDWSDDWTPEISDELDDTKANHFFVQYERNRGKTNALRTGVERASEALLIFMDAVHFGGYLNQRTPIQAYSGANLVCYPSKYEISGNTLTEASAGGTPRVVTGGGEAKRISQDRITGRLQEEYGNVGELVSALGSLFANSEGVSAIGRRAKTHFLEEFSWQICADAHEILYERLV